MTADEESAFHAGKLAAHADQREQATGSRSRCPYARADRRRAWNEGYTAFQLQSRPLPNPAAAENKTALGDAVAAWIAKNK